MMFFELFTIIFKHICFFGGMTLLINGFFDNNLRLEVFGCGAMLCGLMIALEFNHSESKKSDENTSPVNDK